MGGIAVTNDVDSLQWDPGVERLVALSRNAHRGVDQRDDIDYWYRLGQRNAYAHAAGIVVAHGVDSNAFAVSERITAALSDGVSDVAELRAAALDVQHRSIDPEVEVSWIGPLQFHQQYGDLAGIDQAYGMRWGSNGDQRVSLRRPVGADRGLLYVYDPTWDEYGVLFHDVSLATVEAAFSRAVQTDIHMSAQSFAAIVATQAAPREQVELAVGVVLQP